MTHSPASYKLYSSLPDLKRYKTYAEIDTAALRANYRALSEYIHSYSPNSRPMCVVKADAYGHGIDACVEVLLNEGCDAFAVSSIEEAIAVHSVCRAVNSPADILILGYTPPEEAPTLAKCNIIQAVFSLDYASELSASLSESGRSLRIHIKLDTGMNRIGFAAHNDSEIERSAHDIATAAKLPGIMAEGAFTHFARADEADGEDRTHLQAKRFFAILDRANELGAGIKQRHICNSAASLRFPEYHLDFCRLGILLYGAEPSDYFNFHLYPVMRLCTVISQVHTLCAGEQLSYGGKYIAEHDTRIATIPIGYADGFIRAYSGAKAVIYSPDGKKRGEAYIVGRICMDQCMLEIDDIEVHEGDIAVLIGEPGQLHKLSRLASTIEYECLCLISARVTRIHK